jgi:arsenite methyltransferase
VTDQLHTDLPQALRRALDLLAERPANPDVSKGYLDLLTDEFATNTPKNTGLIQAAWASGIGSMLYDNAQALARRVASVWQLPIDWLNIPSGGVALDVGSGPGNVTAQLGQATGPDGLALGLDISEPMLARAVQAQAGPNVGFMRADAQRLPLRDETVDATTSLAVLQLIPNPAQTLAEMVRVLKPGGRMAIMVPTAGNLGPLLRLLPLPLDGQANFFAEDELADILEGLGMEGVRTKSVGTFQWVRARKP